MTPVKSLYITAVIDSDSLNSDTDMDLDFLLDSIPDLGFLW